MIQNQDPFDVIVVGHTDTTPIRKASTRQEHKTNWHLSAHRAIAVSVILIKNPFPATRLGDMGYGEYRPIADNSSAAGKAKNRRVEMYLVPQNKMITVGQNIYEVPSMGLAFLGVR